MIISPSPSIDIISYPFIYFHQVASGLSLICLEQKEEYYSFSTESKEEEEKGEEGEEKGEGGEEEEESKQASRKRKISLVCNTSTVKQNKTKFKFSCACNKDRRRSLKQTFNCLKCG